MSGKLYPPAYYELSKAEITLLSFLMAYAENSGIINAAEGFIIKYTGLTNKEYKEASEGLLENKYLSNCCSAHQLEKIRWDDDLDCCYFTTWRFFATWDSRRLNQYQFKKIKSEVFKRDDYTCKYCGSRGGELECDHIHPVSKGGSNDLDNLATACKPCNRSKRDKTVEEWKGV